MGYEIKIIVDIKPTEDIEKIVNALKKIFGGDFASLEKGEKINDKYIEFTITDISALNFFRLKIRERNIQTHVRNQLERNLIGNKTALYLNKQVATVGKVSLCENPYECPLGAIQIEISADTLTELNKIINWLTS